MGTNIVVPEQLLPGMANDQDIARLVASFITEEVQGQVTLNRMPSKNERELFQIRVGTLAKKLRRCDLATADLDVARRNLAVMFGGFPSLRRADVDDLIVAYLLVLQSYPLFAILEACRDVTNNRIEGADPNWPPTSPLMAKRAAEHVAKVAAEQYQIEKILRATKVWRPPVADGVVERVEASLKDFHGRIAGGRLTGLMTDADRAKAAVEARRRTQQAVLAEWADLGLSPIYTREGQPMSVSLARQAGLIRGEGAHG